jgi:hypothetical protein
MWGCWWNKGPEKRFSHQDRTAEMRVGDLKPADLAQTISALPLPDYVTLANLLTSWCLSFLLCKVDMM